MLVAPLAAQNKQPQNTTPPQTAIQFLSGQASQTTAPLAPQHPQTVVKPTAKAAQPNSSQQLFTFTGEQLDEYEDKIIDRSEGFYNNRMTDLLWTMGILMGIGVVIIPLVVSGLTQWQRKISFANELATQSLECKKTLSQADEKLVKFTNEQIQKLRSQIDKQTKDISSNLSMIYTGIGGLFSSQKSQVSYSLMLQAHALAMKYSIIGGCSGECLTASQIIQLFSQPHVANELTLNTLKVVDVEIESMKVDLSKIADDKKRIDMESQVKDLQIFVHALINEKQQPAEPPPPQAGPQPQ